MPSGSYSAKVDIHYDLNRIRSAQFYWTLPSPPPAKYLFRKPSIYLESVTISDTLETSLERGSIRTTTLRADPNRKITHKERVNVYA